MKSCINIFLITFALCLLSSIAQACELHHNQWIDTMVQRGDLALTFKPNGDLSSVSCNRKKYTALECKNANKYVFDYYHNKKKD